MGRYKSGIRRVTGGQAGQKRGTRRQHLTHLIDQQTTRHKPTVSHIPTQPKSILDPRVSYGRVELSSKPQKKSQRATTHHKFALGNQLRRRIDKICMSCGSLMCDVWPNRKRCIPCATERTTHKMRERRKEYRKDPTYLEKENEYERERRYKRYHTDDAWRLKMCAEARTRHKRKLEQQQEALT